MNEWKGVAMETVNRIKEIFAAAREKPPGAEREDYLSEACGGDLELRQQVESLLKAHDQAGDFLRPTIKIELPDSIMERPGMRIGRYKLLERIGEGGFGVVYMAEQVEPVQRKVALKIIKAGMDTHEVIARFEAERQALALMDHPNIARVLDAGATETGRPYFVMELVRGIAITDYCDQADLSTTDRLRLFMKVCHAVQHAHQKGIIHRDLKPSNVLVTLHDGEPVPKVIDFGVAKALGQKLTEKTLFTGFTQMIGTPAYMSPEQAALSGLDIDTRSDIYSLGVLLYELLTGVTPFDKETLAKAALDEICRMIRETEPPKPSTRLQTLGEKLTDVAKHRHTEPAALRRFVRGDLDWIVMKTIEKDRGRRYETANALAQDVQRHLGNEPVLARPPSNVYRLQKMVHRNKLLFAAGGVVSASLVLGLGISTVLFFKEKAAREQAVAAKRQAEEARANEAVLRRQAEADQKKASTEAEKSEQVARFLVDMLRGVGPSVALGRDTVLLREILSNTVVRVTKDLADQPEVGAELLNTIGEVYAALGQYEKAEEMHEKALEAVAKSGGSESLLAARAHHGLGTAFLGEGKYAGGQTQHRKALEIRKKLLGQVHPEVANSIEALAFALQCCQRFTEAEPLFAQALRMKQQLLGSNHVSVTATLNRFGQFLQDRGRPAEAEPLFREALAIQSERWGTNDPRIISLRARLAAVLEAQGNLAEAETILRDALPANRRLYGTDHPATANAVGGLTHVWRRQGKQGDIEALFREELAAARERYPKYPAERADGLYRVLGVLLSEGAHPEADRIVSTWLEPALTAQPDNIGLLLDHGRFLARRSRFQEAAVDYARMISLEPTNPHPWYMRATLLAEAGNVEAYHDHRRRMLAQFGQTTDPGLMETTAKACLLLPASGADLAVAIELGRKSPSVGSSHPFVPYFELAAGLAEYRQTQYAAAEQWTRKSLSHGWSNVNLQAPNHLVLAMTLQRLGNTNEARVHFSQGAAMVRGTWPESRPGDLGGDWFDWLIARVLLREAKSTVEGAQ